MTLTNSQYVVSKFGGSYLAGRERINSCLSNLVVDEVIISMFSRRFEDSCKKLKYCYQVLTQDFKTRTDCNREFEEDLIEKCEEELVFKRICIFKAKKWNRFVQEKGETYWLQASANRNPVHLVDSEQECYYHDLSGLTVSSSTCASNAQTRLWNIIYLGDGKYSIQNSVTNFCIFAESDSAINMTQCQFDQPSNQFTITKSPLPGLYAVESLAFPGKCLDDGTSLSTCEADDEDDNVAFFDLNYIVPLFGFDLENELKSNNSTSADDNSFFARLRKKD